MKSSRTAPIAFRFDPTTKAALALIAEREDRSLGMVYEGFKAKMAQGGTGAQRAG